MFHPASQPAYLQVTLKSGSHVSWSNLSGIKACQNKQLNGLVQQQGQFELGAFTEPLSPASKSLGNYTLTVYIIIPAPHVMIPSNTNIWVWGLLDSHWILTLSSVRPLSSFASDVIDGPQQLRASLEGIIGLRWVLFCSTMCKTAISCRWCWWFVAALFCSSRHKCGAYKQNFTTHSLRCQHI